MKNQIRKKIKAEIENRIRDLGFESMIERSEKLQFYFESEFLHRASALLTKNYVISFFPFDSEPQITIENFPLQVGYVRILDWKNGVMDAAEARRDLPGQWEEFSIPGSGVGAQIYQPAAEQKTIPSQSIAAILVPGVAFSKNGNRLGRGKGFYDRFLKAHPHALRIGVAFHEQIMQAIWPTDPWDEPLDALITDQEWIETDRFKSWLIHGMVPKRAGNS